jgi:hypothetical protein
MRFISGVILIVLIRSAVLQADVEKVKLRVDPQTVLSHIAPNFIGLGYETSAVAQPGFFTDENVQMVHLYRVLSSEGVIRIGGNISDHTRYAPDAEAEVKPQSQTTVINKTSLNNLGKFAKAVGWKVIWGLNLGSGSKEEAADEAVAVKAAMGDSLHSFQIGNEVDLLPANERKYENYHRAYVDYKAAVRARVSDAVFSGPDCAFNFDWVSSFADAESKDIRLLTLHYYIGGAKDPHTSIEKMLSRDQKWETKLKQMQSLSRTKGVAFRINEVNSFSGGGKPGVSDTFASALWCLDYLFTLASFDCDGVNMETDINQFAWTSHYSPIIHDKQGNYVARPEYYGMLAFAIAGRGDLVKLELGDAHLNLTAYAAKHKDGSIFITIINKDLAVDAEVDITVPDQMTASGIYRLAAPSAQSTDHVTFARTAVGPDGNVQGHLGLLVPHSSAAIVEFGPQSAAH